MLSALQDCPTSDGRSHPDSDPLRRLHAWPGVEGALAARGVELRRLSTEAPQDLENRLGTSLMALYRDERSDASFEALYHFSHPALLTWIRSLVHRGIGRLDPIELLQDTFVNVFRYPKAFREDHVGSFRVWVRTIAGNIVRRANANRSPLSFHELPDGLQEPEDTRADPADIVLSEEQKSRLRAAWVLFLCHYERAWRDLSQRDRRTLYLVEVEGLTYQEAGAVLCVGRSNMKMIVFRSRKRIARLMREAMSGRPRASATTGAA